MKVFFVHLFFFSLAQARPQYYNTLTAQIGKNPVVRCQACHTGAGKGLNYFGSEYSTVLRFDPFTKYPQTKTMSEIQKWEFLFSLDSDVDGITNGDELKFGTNPGVANK